MMALGFSQDYLRMVNLTSSRVGYKFSEIMQMQMGESVVYIPVRDMTLDPIKKAYAHTLENPLLDLLSQAIDLYTDNCRLLGIVYLVTENKVRLIYSRVSNKVIDSGKMGTIDAIRFMDFELTEYERFTYTFMNFNRWNFCNVRQILDVSKEDFELMFKCSASTLNGSIQAIIDLNEFKRASVAKDENASICIGHMIEEQRFYDLDMDKQLKHYATVSTGFENDAIPDMILKEFLNGVTVTESKTVEHLKLVLNV